MERPDDSLARRAGARAAAQAPRDAPDLPGWAAAVCAVAPQVIGGVHLRGPAGPEREAWLQAVRMAIGADAPWCRLPASATDDAMDGGLDLAATLAAGRPVRSIGVLERARGGVLLLPMAERMTRARAVRLAQAIDDTEAGLALMALDEGGDDDDPLPDALCDRLALQVRPAPQPPVLERRRIEQARDGWTAVGVEPSMIDTLVQAAAALGIGSARAPWYALQVARILAALRGARAATGEDIGRAAQLVFSHRARQLPAPPDEPEADSAESEAPPPPDPGEAEQADPATLDEPLEDQVIAAAAAAIPAGLLALLGLGGPRATRRGDAGRSGQRVNGAQRGQSIGSRAGSPRGGARLALVDTLRAAAPWQPLRRRAARARGEVVDPGRVLVQRDDLRVQRRLQHRRSTTIFAIDASGSQAMHRLAEAKGAVELLLADCYARRDQVAVIGFRGTQAQLLLPPTRSLVHAQRQLAGLPGGGGTPLARAIDATAALAASVRRGGATPLVVMLTDGKANIDRRGEPGRAAALADALAAARALAAEGTASLVIDTSPQPSTTAPQLAEALQARCIALPHAGAQAVSLAVRQARGTGGPQRGAA